MPPVASGQPVQSVGLYLSPSPPLALSLFFAYIVDKERSVDG